MTNRAERPKSRKASKPTEKKKSEAKVFVGVSLKQVIDAGLIKPPLKLSKHYKGHDLSADLRTDARVVFDRKEYKSCSTAVEIARGTITGHRMNTNGRMFWQFRDGDGKLVYLDAARQEFIKRNTSKPI